MKNIYIVYKKKVYKLRVIFPFPRINLMVQILGSYVPLKNVTFSALFD